MNDYYEPKPGAGLRRARPRGKGAVIPVDLLSIDGEILDPTRDFLDPSHEWVRARPDCFMPALGPDTDPLTHERMDGLCRLAGVERAAEPGTAAGGRRTSSGGGEWFDDLLGPDTEPGLRLP
jgi:hypothetical protein